MIITKDKPCLSNPKCVLLSLDSKCAMSDETQEIPESRGIKTTFDREWSECGRGPGVISLWLETSRQNKSESAAVSSDRAVMAVTAECDMMPGIVMSALICYDPPGQPLSLSSLFICFSPPHRGLAPGWGECTRVPLLLRKAHNCGSG